MIDRSDQRRTDSDRRIYDQSSVERLAFIKHARQLGFSVEAIRDLLDLSDRPDRPCDQANAIAAAQLRLVEAKIRQLEALSGELRRMVDAGCKGQVSECRVIEALSDHSRCEHHHAEPLAL